MSKLRIYSKRLLLGAVSVCMMFAVTACKKNDTPNEPVQQQAQQAIIEKESLTFDEFLLKLFKEDVTSSPTTFIQFIENPADYDIKEYNHLLQAPSAKTFNDETKACEERLKELTAYDYNTLTKEQKLNYDEIKWFLTNRIAVKDCVYYIEPLSTTDGDHIVGSGLVSLHAARFFETLKARGTQDINAFEEYFEIYKCLGDYFKGVAGFEREKADHNLFMSSDKAKSVIDVCKTQIDKKAADYVTGFEDEILKLDWVSDDDKKALIQKNTELVQQHIVTGYEAIMNAMNDCMDKADIMKGLYETEAGKEYYRYLLKTKVSADVTPEEAAALLETKITEWNKEKADILAKRPKILAEINTAMSAYKKPDDIVGMLNTHMAKDFPKVDITWGVTDMPNSLNGFAAGLFYPPAFDSSTKKEYVYAGTLLSPGTASYVSTIAHEGAPGHLYHYSYVANSDCTDYRRLLGWTSYTGYLEGWTTYIEGIAYKYAGLDEEQVRILQLDRLLELAIIERCDIGVNYEGWEFDQLSKYLADCAPVYVLMTAHIKTMCEDTKGIMSSYVLGYLYLTDMKEEMRTKLGDSFSDMKFHEDYLNVGPASYDLIRRELGLSADK